VIFVMQEGDHVLFSTIKGRRKTANMVRDPRVNLLVHSLPVAGPDYATISGTVELTDDPDRSLLQVMYDLYMGGATPPPEPDAERLIGRITPDRVYTP
jgi:PPOX class probable F420-dependent enzyme